MHRRPEKQNTNFSFSYTPPNGIDDLLRFATLKEHAMSNTPRSSNRSAGAAGLFAATPPFSHVKVVNFVNFGMRSPCEKLVRRRVPPPKQRLALNRSVR